MSWRQLWGPKRSAEEEKQGPIPLASMEHYSRNLFRESMRAAWEFVVENKVPAFICGVIVPVLVVGIRLKFGGQTFTDMKEALINAASSLAVYLALCGVFFLCFLFYRVPKRRMAAALARIAEMESERDGFKKQRDDLVAKKNEPQPVFAALDELKRLEKESQELNVRFQLTDLPDAPPTPGLDEIIKWHQAVSDCVSRDAFKDYLDSNDRAQFQADWPRDEVTRAVKVMQRFGHLSSSRDEINYRCLWSKLRRLQELIELIEAGPMKSSSRIQFGKRQSEREGCLLKAAKLLKRDNMQVVWAMNALFLASADRLQKWVDVAWVCQELVNNSNEHPFEGIMDHVPVEDYLKFLKRALIRGDIKTEKSGDYLVLAAEWPKLNGYPEPKRPIPDFLWVKKILMERQEQ